MSKFVLTPFQKKCSLKEKNYRRGLVCRKVNMIWQKTHTEAKSAPVPLIANIILRSKQTIVCRIYHRKNKSNRNQTVN